LVFRSINYRLCSPVIMLDAEVHCKNSRDGHRTRTTGSNHYEKLKDTIERLSANNVNVSMTNKTYGKSLIRSFVYEEDDGKPATHWKVLLEPDIIQLFDGFQYSQIDWAQRLKLSPMAKWLHSFYYSHRKPFAFKVATIHELCGSSTKHLYTFRPTLKKAILELEKINFIEKGFIDTTDKLQVVRVLPKNIKV